MRETSQISHRRPRFPKLIQNLLLATLALGSASVWAQEVEQEQMICRDMGDIFCTLDEFSETVTPATTGLGAKPGPAPTEKQKSRNDRSVIDLQQSRLETTLDLRGQQGLPQEVRLINLNPDVGAWYLLKLVWNPQRIEWFHLENGKGKDLSVELSSTYHNGIVLINANGDRQQCDLWGQSAHSALYSARSANTPYAKLCGIDLYLRNKIDGYKTTKEWVVEFLRSNIAGGETITTIVKETVYKDSFLIHSEGGVTKETAIDLPDAPEPAQVSASYKGEQITTKELGIAVEGSKSDALDAGRWYRSANQPGVFVSAIEPRAIDENLLKSNSDYVKPLDNVEMGAAAYLVAFDIGAFDLSFAVGTDHPAVGWSDRVLPEVRDTALKGPDGFQTIAPLTATGLVPPYLHDRVAGIFTGGFKRDHGAFHWGELAKQNRGSHYGFVENGVVLSELQPELSTLVVYKDGQIDFKTWKDIDNETISRVRFARQNGVPIIDYDPVQKKGVPGRYVSNWTLGNWSGSQDRKFRSLRAGICLQNRGVRKFLIYGYFSSMTPTAMARVFQAYNCSYAMHLDMNALEHTYMALYPPVKPGQERIPQHLVRGMKVLDERFKGNVPRYMGYPDNRDFFYFTRKPVQKTQ
ncbi:MAG: hypothetical protein H7249_20845 [Chitinophagaceae bacterium]|nr:hypothetical protein [Oligoflexus sp.]